MSLLKERAVVGYGSALATRARVCVCVCVMVKAGVVVGVGVGPRHGRAVVDGPAPF